jgi:hypothetical protein
MVPGAEIASSRDGIKASIEGGNIEFSAMHGPGRKMRHSAESR